MLTIANLLEAMERRCLDRYLVARFAFANHASEAHGAIFRERQADLVEWVQEFGPIVTATSRYVPEFDRTERRWRVREDRRKFHRSDVRWRAA